MPQNTLPQDPSQLDPKVVKVMGAIKQIESGGDYGAVGDLDKGVSRGAYQFNRNNFKTWASEHGLDPNDFSPANQNKVAYARIKKLKDQGRQPEEIAAIWNGAKYDKTTGKYDYINPQYGEKFRAALGATKQPQVAGGITGTYPAPPQQHSFVPTGEQSSVSGEPQKDKSFLRKTAEFFLPVLEEKERTPMQWAGDIGLSALSVMPFAGLAGKGLQAAGLISKTAKGAGLAAKAAPSFAKTVATGAGIGYGADVASGLSSGETDIGKIATPGLGTAVGGIGGGVLGTLKKSSTGLLSRTSGVPQGALQVSAERAPAVKGLIKAGTTPKETRKIAVDAVKTMRKNMSTQWESGVDDIVQKYTGRRVGLPEGVAKEYADIASRYNTATKTRVTLPQNISSMSAKELTDAIKDLNAIKYNPMQPDRALLDMKAYLKELGKKSFNDGGEFTTLYSNYATKSDILDAADDVVRAYTAKKPTQVTTAINKLQNIFNEGSDEYLQAIQALEKETGVDILSRVAADKVASWKPRDFARGLQLDDLLQMLGFFVTSPRAASNLNAILTGHSTGAAAKILGGSAKLAPVVPGLLERQ